MRVFHFVIKKRKRALRPDSFFFNDSDIFKNILILIITSLAIHYSQNVFRGFSILVCIGVQVFVRVSFFFTPPLARDSLSRLLRACLRLTEKRWKITPALQIQLVESKSCGKYCLIIIRMRTNTVLLAFFLGM